MISNSAHKDSNQGIIPFSLKRKFGEATKFREHSGKATNSEKVKGK